MRYRSALLALLATTLSITAPAVSAQTASRIAPSSGYEAPLGFLLFCLQSRQYCQPQRAEEVVLSQDMLAHLQSINRTVNRDIRPRNETRDTWSIGVSSGDCEDYALTKRAMLAAAGIPAGALRIGVGTLGGQDHAVLIVRTNAGDLVLDNMTDAIMSWDRTDIDWIAMSGPDPMHWQRIG